MKILLTLAIILITACSNTIEPVKQDLNGKWKIEYTCHDQTWQLITQQVINDTSLTEINEDNCKNIIYKGVASADYRGFDGQSEYVFISIKMINNSIFTGTRIGDAVDTVYLRGEIQWQENSHTY